MNTSDLPNKDWRDPGLSGTAGSAIFLRRYNAWRRDECGDEEMPDPSEIGWHIDNAANVLERITEMLPRLAKAYARHKETTACDMKARGRKCTGCHFWQGAIAALNEAIGEPGCISFPPNNEITNSDPTKP